MGPAKADYFIRLPGFWSSLLFVVGLRRPSDHVFEIVSPPVGANGAI
jgi:hypothetical protein